MLKDDTEEKIKEYVSSGGSFVATYLTGVVDKDDLCYLGGLPANDLKEVFGIWAEETDSFPEGIKSLAGFNGKEYQINHICDIIHANSAKVLGEYKSDFYKGMPSVTENKFGKGKAYYVAFRNDKDLAEDFCNWYIKGNNLPADSGITTSGGVSVRKQGEYIFILNFNDSEQEIELDKEYINLLTNEKIAERITLPAKDFIILE